MSAVRAARPSTDGRAGPGGGRRQRGGGRDGQPVVPDAEFRSYYGRQILQTPSWKAGNIAGYFFLGGLAAGSSLLAAGGDLTHRPGLRRAGRLAAIGAVSGSLVGLINDLGRPERFLNMLRVARPTSPMSVGSWLLAAYGPLAGAAAASEVLDWVAPASRLATKLGPPGRVAGLGAAALAPAVASYTAVLLADTAVPAWHDAHRELPLFFAGSAAAAAGGLALAAVPMAEAEPARRLAVLGVVAEAVAGQRMEQRLGTASEALRTGRAGRLMRLAKVLSAAGALVAALFGRRSRPAAVSGGLAMVAGSACTRFAVFYAGVAASEDPKYTVVPQRERADGKRQ